MKIAIHTKTFNHTKFPYIKQVFDELNKRGVHLMISDNVERFLREFPGQVHYHSVYRSHQELQGVSFMISIGGDGTLLETVTLVKDNDIPILGINTGRLGFLATLNRDQIQAGLEALFNQDFTLEERSLLSLEAGQDIFGDLNFALNDFTITKRDIASMIVVHTFLDGEYLNSYWADGLIVATPTGSTAYCLSAGGPVVVPHAQSFVVVPISPHNLNVRPLVVPDNCELRFEVEGRINTFLASLDSRYRIVDSSVRLTVRKCAFKTKLVRFKGQNFLKTLRQKVNWGLDHRN
jgi:NAD+ kinase